MEKKILIAGGGHAEIPLIRAAKELEFYVFTTGNREGDLGHKYSDRYVNADFSDKEALLNLAEKLNIDAICPCANDFSALSSAYVAERMGFPGHDSLETAEIIHHKDRYREFAAANGISSPKAESFDNNEDALQALEKFSYPLIVKPVDLTGGKGVSRIDDPSEGKQAIEKAFSISRAKRVVIEEFIEGTNHGFSCFLRNKKVVFYFWDNEHYYLNRYMVSGASSPGDVSENALGILINESEKIASILHLQDGIFHIQFILKDDKPYIIEICRRPPGDLYIDFVKYATGVDYPKYIVRAFAGMDIESLEQTAPKGFYTRHCVMANKTGRLKDIYFNNAIQNNIIDKLMWWKKGDEVTDVMTAKFGIIFLKYETKEEMQNKSRRLHELVDVVTDYF